MTEVIIIRIIVVSMALAVVLLTIVILWTHRQLWLAIEALHIVARLHSERMDDIEQEIEHDQP